MPILVIAVVAFIIFNIMMVLFISAVISEQRYQRLEDRSLATAGGSAGLQTIVGGATRTATPR